MRVVSIVIGVIVAVLAVFFVHHHDAAQAEARVAQVTHELEEAKARATVAEADLAKTQEEANKFKTDAAEVHKLRGEIATVRASNKDLELKASQAAQAAARAAAKAATPVPAPVQAVAPATPTAIPATFSSYAEMGTFTAGLRAKAAAGTLTAEEKDWLQRMKPEFDKLERSPAEFASFQAGQIQAATGITDPQKTEQIRSMIERVYTAAGRGGLDALSRPENDPTWADRRNQLDNRGTQAVKGVMTESERAAFERTFPGGIMGVDLGGGAQPTQPAAPGIPAVPPPLPGAVRR